MNTDMLPSVSIENTTARENDAYLAFDVRLSKPAKQTIAVDFETVSGGTATEGADYWRSRHRILFLPGESEKPAAVALIADTVSDDGETVMGEISNARVIAAAGPEFGGVTITNAQATGTINAASTTTTAVPDVDIRILDTTGNEGDGGMDFPVRLSRGLSDYVCYDFETLTTGTADLGDDYLARPKSTQWMWPRNHRAGPVRVDGGRQHQRQRRDGEGEDQQRAAVQRRVADDRHRPRGGDGDHLQLRPDAAGMDRAVRAHGGGPGDRCGGGAAAHGALGRGGDRRGRSAHRRCVACGGIALRREFLRG